MGNKDRVIEVARRWYLCPGVELTEGELQLLGFDARPSGEYLREAVLETLAAEYMGTRAPRGEG